MDPNVLGGDNDDYEMSFDYSNEKKWWLFRNFGTLGKSHRRNVRRFLQHVALNILRVDDKSGDFVCDLNTLPAEIIEKVYDIATSENPRKRRRSEIEDFNSSQTVGEYEPSMKRRKLDHSTEEEVESAESDDEEDGKSLKFTISVKIISLRKKDDSKTPYQCDVCEKKFSDKSNLRKHVRIHTEEMPYKCSVCNKSFRYSQTLREHMNRHKKIKPHKCDHPNCGKSFASASNLKRHKRIHSGEKPYECDVCNAKFKQSSNLKAHYKNKHNIVKDRVTRRKK